MNLGSTDITASISRISIIVIYYTPKQMDSKFKGPVVTSNTNWFKLEILHSVHSVKFREFCGSQE